MHLNSLSFNPIEPRPGTGTGRPAPAAPAPSAAPDAAEIGAPAAPANVYQAMHAAVQATSTPAASNRENLVALGRASFSEPGPAPALVRGPGDEAYVSAGSAVYRMKPDGTLTQLSKEPAGPVSPPAVDGSGNVFFRSRNGEVVAVGPEGKELWRTATNPKSQMANQERVGLFPDAGLYAIQLDGSNEVIHGLSGEGKLEWTFKLDPAERLVGVGPNGTLFTEKHENGGNRTLQCIQPSRWMGKRRWKAEGLSSKLPTAWITAQGTPVVLRKDGTLAGLDQDGKERWAYQGRIDGVMTRADGGLVLTEESKQVLTRLSAEGAQEGKERFPNHLVETGVGTDGTVYAIDTDSQITALRADGSRSRAPYPYSDTTRLEITPGGVVYSGTRRPNFGGAKQVTNEVVAFRMREPAPAAPEAPKSTAPEPVPTPEDGWIVIGDISLPVREG